MSENTNKIQKNAELIFTYIYNNRIIFISSFILIIVIIAGILVYKMNIESQDEKINVDFESALALYNVYQNSQLPAEQLNDPGFIIDITSRFQKEDNFSDKPLLLLLLLYNCVTYP